MRKRFSPCCSPVKRSIGLAKRTLNRLYSDVKTKMTKNSAPVLIKASAGTMNSLSGETFSRPISIIKISLPKISPATVPMTIAPPLSIRLSQSIILPTWCFSRPRIA